MSFYHTNGDVSSLPDNRRIVLASLLNTPVSDLNILAKDNNSSVRVFVAENKKTPFHVLEVLERLARDIHSKIRVSVAKNENTPVHVLEELSKDNSILVRLYIASNENTPLSTLYELYKKDNKVRNEPYIIENLSSNINTISNSNLNIIENLSNKLMRDNTKIENMEELISYAFENNRVFSTIDDVYEAYDLTYGKDGLTNPMIAVKIYAVQGS